MSADIKEYRVTGAILSLGEMFSTSELALFSGVDEESVSRLCAGVLSSALRKAGEQYQLIPEAKTGLREKMKDMYPHLPRPLLIRTPSTPLQLLIVEDRVYRQFRDRTESVCSNDILHLAEVTVRDAADEIKELVLCTNERTRPLVAHLEYRLVCVQTALKAIQEEKAPTPDCLTESDIDLLSNGQPLPEERFVHVSGCALCMGIMATMPPGRRLP